MQKGTGSTPVETGGPPLSRSQGCCRPLCLTAKGTYSKASPSDPVPCRWPYAKTAAALQELGCKHVNKNVTDVHVDVRNKLVTTGAFMCNGPIHEIYDGIGKLVTQVLKLA